MNSRFSAETREDNLLAGTFSLGKNKSDKKDKLSHQSLNITSSSNPIVKILCDTITLIVTSVRINTGSRSHLLNQGVERVGMPD